MCCKAYEKQGGTLLGESEKVLLLFFPPNYFFQLFKCAALPTPMLLVYNLSALIHFPFSSFWSGSKKVVFFGCQRNTKKISVNIPATKGICKLLFSNLITKMNLIYLALVLFTISGSLASPEDSMNTYLGGESDLFWSWFCFKHYEKGNFQLVEEILSYCVEKCLRFGAFMILFHFLVFKFHFYWSIHLN